MHHKQRRAQRTTQTGGPAHDSKIMVKVWTGPPLSRPWLRETARTKVGLWCEAQHGIVCPERPGKQSKGQEFVSGYAAFGTKNDGGRQREAVTFKESIVATDHKDNRR